MLFTSLGGILWIALLALVTFGLAHLIRGGRRNPARDAALVPLGQGYASGNIDRDELLRRQKDLALTQIFPTL